MAKRKWTKGQTMTCTEQQRLSSKTQQTTTKLKNYLSFQSFDLSVPDEG
jgi:hypothetical protein